MQKLTIDAAGVHVIAPTPFDETGALDLASTARMVERYLEAGATGLTILGIMGEAPKLTGAESRIFVKEVLARAGGKIVVTVGVSSPGFAAMSDLTKAVMDMGASGVMIAPAANLRTDDQIVGYFRQAVEAIGADVPFVLQDYPLTFSVQMTPAAPCAITSCVSARMAAKPGAETPTTTGSPLARRIIWRAAAMLSWCSSLGASPSWPSTVMPVAPHCR